MSEPTKRCPFCKGKGTAIAVDAINPDGTVENPRPSVCMACDGSGIVPVNPDLGDVPVREVDLTERMADAMYAAATAGGNAPFPWENAYLPGRAVFVRAALAGLAAIREPTPAMVAAGNAAMVRTHGAAASVPWRAMVDAARGEPPCP